jgi:adenosylcobyric acid synthase
VLLVANIDVGGVFAQIVGTLELLEDWERRLVRGLVINKFRGDLSLFRSGVEFLEERTGVPVLGVVPYFTDIPIEEEDSLAPERAVRHGQQARADEVDVAVVFLPHISNFTDFDALEAEPDVLVRYVRRAEELDGADCVILPGSKSTIADLQVIRRAGIADYLQRMARQGTPVVGLCGGYQMLGRKVYDPQHTESDTDETDGLGLLDVETTFEPTKVTTQTTARLLGRGPFFDPLQGREVEGYEIHMGRTTEGRPSALEIIRRQGQPAGEVDGAVSENGLVFGCYLHGLFDSSGFRRHFLNVLRQRKGLAPLTTAPDERPDPLDELAHRVRQSLNMPLLYQIVGLD